MFMYVKKHAKVSGVTLDAVGSYSFIIIFKTIWQKYQKEK